MSQGDDRSGRLSEREASEVTRQLAGLTGSGLPLPEGLRALGEEHSSPSIRRVLFRLADDIERGRSLDEAIQAQGVHFPAHLRGIVEAAARSGRMAEILGESVRLDRIRSDLKRQIWFSLAYPLTLLTLFLSLFVFVAIVIVGQFEQIYIDFGIDLPILTVALIHTARVLSDAGWVIIPGLWLGWLAVWLAGRGLGPARRRRVVNEIPLIGPLWRFTALAEFSHLLALLLECKLPLPEALPLAGAGVRDADLSLGCQRAASEVQAGIPLPEAILRARAFPRGFAALLAWAETARSLPEALRVAGEIFEARARPQATLLGAFILALTVALVILGVAWLVVGLFLPLVKLISELSG